MQFAVDCAFGVADKFDSPSRYRLRSGKPLTAPRFDDIAPVRDAVNSVAISGTLESAQNALRMLRGLKAFAFIGAKPGTESVMRCVYL